MEQEANARLMAAAPELLRLGRDVAEKFDHEPLTFDDLNEIETLIAEQRGARHDHPINAIVNSDCFRILPQLDAGSVDFVLTDPPYLGPIQRPHRPHHPERQRTSGFGCFHRRSPRPETERALRFVLRLEPR